MPPLPLTLTLQLRPTFRPKQDGRFPLDLEAASTVARLVAAIRGAGKPHTTPVECRSLNAAFLADLYQVRPDAQLDTVSGLRSCPGEPSGQVRGAST